MWTVIISIGTFLLGCLITAWVIATYQTPIRKDLIQKITYIKIQRDYYKEKLNEKEEALQ